MKKIATVSLLLLVFAISSLAQTASLPDNPVPNPDPPKPAMRITSAPSKPWYKDWKVWRMIGTSIASSAIATKEAHDCRMRKNAGISFCDGGYGPFAARESVRMGTSLLLDGIGIWGRHMGIKEYSLFADGFTGYNIYVAAQQTGIGCKAGTWPVWGTKYNCIPWTWTKQDLSKVVILSAK